MTEPLTRLPLRSALLRLALPLAGSMAMETAFNFVNGYWVGQLGTVALAAVNMCSFSLWMMMALTGTISTGCNAVVARLIGARQELRSLSVAWLCVGLALVWGALLSVLAHRYAAGYLAWQGGEHADLRTVLQAATAYLSKVFLFAPAFCLNEVLSAILRARGDTRTPFKLYAFGVGLNFALDPLLIFGWRSIPALGLDGAAYASGISFSVMSLLFLVVLRRRLDWQRPRLADAGEVVRIGLPGSLTAAFFSFIYVLITPTVATYGPSALAALGVGHRIESFSYLLSHGMGLAAITLVGQHMGAGNPRRAFLAGREACRLVSYFMLVSTLAMWLAARPLAAIFTHDPEVLDRAVTYLRWMSMAQWCTGLAVVLEGVMAGAGRPILTMFVSTSCAASRWPATWLGSRHFGLNGVWGALTVARCLEALLCTLVFWKSSVWKIPRPEGQISP